MSRKLTLVIGLVIAGASLSLFNVPRYLEVSDVKKNIGKALGDLEDAYREYLDNRKALDMIRKSLKSISTFEDLKKLIPKGVRVTRKGDRIEIYGRMTAKEFNEIVNFIMKTSNMAIYVLHVENPNDSPFELGGVEKPLTVDMVVVNPEVGG